MKRGDIWTFSGSSNYARKPRPVVIVQDDAFDATDTVTICSVHHGSDRGPLVPPGGGAERAQRFTFLFPADGGQNHHRPETQGRRAGRSAGRRGCNPAQPGGDGVPRLGRIVKIG
jgi:hypothetical protein